MSENDNIQADPKLGYDRRAANVGVLALLGIATTILLVAIVAGVWIFYVISERRVEEEQVGRVYSEELRSIHTREEEQLNHYGFLDKERGVVRLPIDRSIELLAAEYAAGKVSYNTKTYPLRPEQPQAAPGSPAAGAPAAPPAPGSAAAPSVSGGQAPSEKH